MSGIIRVHRKSKNYTIVSNVPFLDTRLSFGARGILAYLLTKPDHWEVRSEDLIAESPHGRHAILGMLKELEDCGYLVRNRVRGEKGLWAWETEVFESPRKVDSAPKSAFPTTDNPTHDNPTCDNPTSYKGSKELNEESVLREQSAHENSEDESRTAPALQDDTPTFSESEPSPQNSRRPIDLSGTDDDRYHTDQYAAVLEVCGLRDDLLKLDPKARATTAMYAAGLAESFTGEQIRDSGKAWARTFDSPPHAKQLLQHVPKFVISQEKTNATRNSADPASATAIRAAREARKQAAQDLPAGAT